ncbi:hypothetical protein MKEN_01174500 [Mycena kentingensis (nom. inval.)]|nr:hypothetical protein MKEN_01174500 [Mycena kentingensis (nom. inval.)]
MTTITPPQDRDGSPSAAPPPPLPARKRRTHANAEICSFLKQMPLEAVEQANKEIKTRNKDRWLARYKFQREKASAEANGETPPTFEDSDDESLISLPPPPTPSTPKSPKAKALAFLGALSPSSLAASMRIFKRKIDSPEGQPPPKKFARPPPILLDADAGLVVFDAVLRDLHSYNKYISASLFTNENLAFLNQNALLLQRSKQYVQGSDKQILLLDQANFEALRGREEDLDRADWAESAANQVRWAREMQDDALVTFLREHYQWLGARPEPKKFYKAVLRTDIAMRKKWMATPFLFDEGRWHKMEYEKHQREVHIDQKWEANASSTSLPPAATFLPSTSLLPPANITPSVPAGQPAPKTGRLGALAAQGRALFQKGTAGGPRQDVCLLCAKRGHKQARCNEKTFPDGKPIRARIHNYKLVGTDGKEICRAWNATTPLTGLSNGNANETRSSCNASLEDAEHFLHSLPFLPPPRPTTTDSPSPPSHPVFDPPTSSLSPEFAEIRTRINCPYDVDAMERLLRLYGLEEQHPGLVDSMRNGFSMGSFKPLEETVVFPNHRSVNKHREFVESYLDEEVQAGRMSGPFTKDEVQKIVGGHFQCSPMIVAEQAQELGKPSKLRLCRHLSKGDASHPSTNDHIDKDDFPTRFGTAAEVAEIVASAPEGTQGMTLDIAKFHRTCPILPEHKRWFVVQDSRGFYIDHNCPFGCASSSSNAGRIAMAVMDIAKARGVEPLNRYEDDFLAACFPSAVRRDPETGRTLRTWYAYDREKVLEAVKELKVPWHPDKGQDFDEKVIYIGFEWDFRLKQVVLPENKRLKFLRRVTDFHELKTFSLHDIMKIHGSLCHIAYVYPNGRSYIAPLSNAIVIFDGSKTARHHHTTATDNALKWWRATLSVPGTPRDLRPRGPVKDLRLYVDASTDWGVGTYWDGLWDAFKTIEGWKSKSRHITWLEAVALELIVYTVEEAGLHDAYLRVYSDNQGVIGAFRKGRSPNSEINLAIRRMEVVLDARNIALELVYVPSLENPADKLSRGERGDERDRMPFRFELPVELKPTYFCFRLPTLDVAVRTGRNLRPGPVPEEASSEGPAQRGEGSREAEGGWGQFVDTRLDERKTRPLVPIPSSDSSARPRRPKKGNEIEENELRPHVLAKDRIRSWRTPWGIRNDELVRSTLPDKVVDRTFAAIHAAWAPNSTSSYAAGPLRFTQFCDEHGVSEEDRMPASHVLLSAFVAQHAGSVSGDAVSNWLSGLKAWHDANGAPWHGNERWVKLTKRTAEKMGSGFKKEQRGPVTIQHMRALKDALDLNKPQDAAIWAAATAAFWGCRRLGEVTVPSAAKFDPKYAQ